jgi:glycolate oxidase iron-sulfur subunit
MIFDVLLPRPRGLRMMATALRAYQRMPVAWPLRRSGLLKRLSPRLANAEAQLPRLSERFFSADAIVYPAVGERRLRVGFFTGCVMPYLYAGVHEATLRVLRRNGCEVVVPADQRCCGALNVHSGERRRARELARANVRAFLAAGVDAVVVNAAGCGSTLKEYGELLRDDPELGRRFSALVKDVNELLAGLGLAPGLGRLERTVTLQESCHLVHAQRVRAAPRELLAAIPGLKLVDMARPDMCCGSAGSYSLVQPEMSSELLERKMKDVRSSGAETIVTANPGCLLQLEYGGRAFGPRLPVKHVVELLDEAYREGERA